ncbi:HNH endonuclease signature motif containing protein [Pseudomonas sp. HLMP]|uniref:HNH endonuclease signature motif containing protein n=1 Tax=Pseudomonas sp. HLMP TaxID=3153767 RepID=UPI003966E3DB
MKVNGRRGNSASRGYGHRWRLAREVFLANNPFCVMCSTNRRPVASTVVDHKIAPRLQEAKESGDPEKLRVAWKLFWDQDNWQPLCKLCHDSVKQRLERSGRIAGCDASGLPLDPNHHWNRR